jgi:hypothetical protein
MFPDMPVDAYVPPFGWRETDHAAPEAQTRSLSRTMNPCGCGCLTLTRLNVGHGSKVALEAAYYLPCSKVPETGHALEAVVQRVLALWGDRERDETEGVCGQ